MIGCSVSALDSCGILKLISSWHTMAWSAAHSISIKFEIETQVALFYSSSAKKCALMQSLRDGDSFEMIPKTAWASVYRAKTIDIIISRCYV